MEVVDEWEHGIGLGIRDDAIGRLEQLGAQSAWVDHAEVGAEGSVADRLAQGVGNQVAQSRFACAVVAGLGGAVCVAVGEGRGDVGSNLADRLSADDFGLSERLVDDRVDFLDPRELADQCVVLGLGTGDIACRVGHDLIACGVVGQLDLADALSVGAGLHNRSGRIGAGDGRVPHILLVRVTGEDRVDLGIGLRRDLGERAAGGDLVLEARAVGSSCSCPFVEGGDDDVRGSGRGLQLADDAVDSVDGVAEVDIGDP